METQPESLQNQLAKTVLKIRCPHCLKLYSVNRAEMHESRPKFQCRDCHTKFWVAAIDVAAHDEEVMGFPMDWLSGKVETPKIQDSLQARSSPIETVLEERVYSCPKCTEPYSAGQHECTKCGLIFAKFIERSLQKSQDDDWPAPPEVKHAWEAVIVQYEDYSAHQKFIRLADLYECLDYAAKRYATIIETCPSDELAKRAQKEILAIASTRFEVRTQATPNASSSWFESFDLFMRNLKFTSLILLLCGVVITMGVLMPGDRNLVGIGASILFFVLVLRYYFRVI